MIDEINKQKKKYLKYGIACSIFGIIITFICGILWVGVFIAGLTIDIIPGVMTTTLFTIALDWAAIANIKAAIRPFSNNLINKYGSVENIQNILNNIESTIEYEDNNVLLSTNYLMQRSNPESIMSYNSIVSIKKIVYGVQYYLIIITDNFNYEKSLIYPKTEKETVDKIMSTLSLKCTNASITNAD